MHIVLYSDLEHIPQLQPLMRRLKQPKYQNDMIQRQKILHLNFPTALINIVPLGEPFFQPMVQR